MEDADYFLPVNIKMTASSVIPLKWSGSCPWLAIFLIVVLTSDKILAEDGSSSVEIQTDTSGAKVSEGQNEHPANRVLPVDAEHKSKITIPQQTLDPICIQTLRENLVKVGNK